MRKVLIVSPRFPPKNAADLHRVRTSLPYYRQFGWIPAVLTLTPESSDGYDDELLASNLPKDVEVHRARAWSETKCRRFGFGQVGYRSLFPLFCLGAQLIKREKYDVIVFSTTVFLTFILGPIWKCWFGCKLVYDFHDPWYGGETAVYTRETVPGSWWKYALDQRLAKHFERFVMKHADHIMSVSDGYVTMLKRRYPWLQSSQFTIIPFGVSRADYDFLRDRRVEQKIIRTDERMTNWVYVGACASDMEPIIRSLFQAVHATRCAHPDWVERLRLFFIGTDYAASGRTRKRVEPLAGECQVQDLVEEHPQRIPYFESLAAYRDCDAVLLIGSTRSDYTASKFFNCVLSKKPILALLHRDSLVSKLAPRFPNVFLASFDDDPSESKFMAQIRAGIEWLRAPNYNAEKIDLEIKPWMAENLAKAQCEVFDHVVSTIADA